MVIRLVIQKHIPPVKIVLSFNELLISGMHGCALRQLHERNEISFGSTLLIYQSVIFQTFVIDWVTAEMKRTNAAK